MGPDRRNEIAAAINAALVARGGGELTLERQATGGLSQETWFGRLETDAAAEVVLRLPTASSGTKAIRVQRVALQAVADSIPAPAVLRYNDDVGGDGGVGERPWLIMERVSGEIPVGWHEIAEPRRRLALAEAAIDVLAALHGVDPPDGLRPRRSDGSDVEVSPVADLKLLERRLGRLEPLPFALRVALRWLDERCPAPRPAPVLVHGDFRMGNMVIADDDIEAVLDWELATLGDPMADLAWCFIPIWELPGVDDGPLTERYAKRRGEALDLERLRWYRVFNFARLVYFALSGSRAFAAGDSDDLRLAALGLDVPVRLDRLMRTIRSEVVE